MGDSILQSIKKQLGIDAGYDVFDQDLILLINSTFSILNQLDVGPEETFTISGNDAVWSDFKTAGKDIAMVREFVYLGVRLTFDPPASSYVLTAFNNRYKELEWRLNSMAENLKEDLSNE